MLFYLLISSSTMQQECTDIEQQFTTCCLELTHSLLSMGANLNTRIVRKTFHAWGNEGEAADLICSVFMDLSPLALLEEVYLEVEELSASIGACLRSVGVVYHRYFRFVKISREHEEPWYVMTDTSSQRLDRALYDDSGRKVRSISKRDALPEVLLSIRENNARISYADVIASVEKSDESF